MGDILDLAKRDARKYMNSGGFEVELLITPPGGYEIAIKGLATNHTNAFDTEGKPILSNQVHCSFSELDLNEKGITTRNSRGELDIKDFVVQFADAVQEQCYQIKETHPDNLLGLIRCTLTNYE